MMEGEGFHSDGAELLEFETYDGHKFKNGLMQQTGTLLVSETQQKHDLNFKMTDLIDQYPSSNTLGRKLSTRSRTRDGWVGPIDR